MSNLELWKLFVHYVKDLQPIIAIRNNYMDLGIKMGIWLFHQAIQKCKISTQIGHWDFPVLYGNEKSFNFSQMDRKDCLVFKDLAR